MKTDFQGDSLIKKVEKQELEAEEFGFYWDSFEQLIEQIQSECREIEEARGMGDKTLLEEELGDLMHASIALAVFCRMNPYDVLHKSIQKFQRRFDALVKRARQDGFETLHNQPFDVLMKYWNQAKLETKKGG